MLMQPGTLQLTDCLNLCRQNSSCLAINFETGLCVLLQESADKNPQALQKSQFPVFTIYAHKICLQGKWTVQASLVHLVWSLCLSSGIGSLLARPSTIVLLARRAWSHLSPVSLTLARRYRVSVAAGGAKIMIPSRAVMTLRTAIAC